MTKRLGVWILAGGLLLAAYKVASAQAINGSLPPDYAPSGEQMYKQYCAACHGADAKGQGPISSQLKTPPPDLTTLSARHQGKFPYEYVASLLEFGPGANAHGTSDMPTWGPIFRYYNKQSERAVKKRIKDLSDYLASLQGH